MRSPRVVLLPRVLLAGAGNLAIVLLLVSIVGRMSRAQEILLMLAMLLSACPRRINSAENPVHRVRLTVRRYRATVSAPPRGREREKAEGREPSQSGFVAAPARTKLQNPPDEWRATPRIQISPPLPLPLPPRESHPRLASFIATEP